jgi:hypothetical protein
VQPVCSPETDSGRLNFETPGSPSAAPTPRTVYSTPPDCTLRVPLRRAQPSPLHSMLAAVLQELLESLESAGTVPAPAAPLRRVPSYMSLIIMQSVTQQQDKNIAQ